MTGENFDVVVIEPVDAMEPGRSASGDHAEGLERCRGQALSPAGGGGRQGETANTHRNQLAVGDPPAQRDAIDSRGAQVADRHHAMASSDQLHEPVASTVPIAVVPLLVAVGNEKGLRCAHTATDRHRRVQSGNENYVASPVVVLVVVCGER